MAVSQLQPLLKGIGMARLRFLYGLDRTPDDRLNWSPGGEAKTPLAVAGRLTGFLGFFSHLLETGAMPERPVPLSHRRARPKPGSKFLHGNKRLDLHARTGQQFPAIREKRTSRPRALQMPLTVQRADS